MSNAYTVRAQIETDSGIKAIVKRQLCETGADYNGRIISAANEFLANRVKLMDSDGNHETVNFSRKA